MFRIRSGYSRFLAVLCLLATGPSALARAAEGPSCQTISSTRVSGVAPLGVVFEGQLSVAHPTDEVFLDLAYRWHFGDHEDEWSVGSDVNRSRNVDAGPIAAHVFERAGSYLVRMQVWDSAGRSCSSELRIQVDDPDLIFAGTHTTCVSTSGNFSGCPKGARTLTSDDFDKGVSFCKRPKNRCLFRANEVFAGSWQKFNFVGPTSVGAFDDGGETYREQATLTRGTFDYGANVSEDHRVWSFNLPLSPGEIFVALGDCSQFGADCTNRRLILVHRSTTTGGRGTITGWVNDADFGVAPYGIVISELTGSGWVGGSGKNGVAFGCRSCGLIGLDLSDSSGVEHVMRIPFMQRATISHSRFADAAWGKHCLKLHNAGGMRASPQLYTEQISITDSVFEQGSLISWALAIAPQNDGGERLRDIRIERNHFNYRGVKTPNPAGLVLDAQRVRIRNNTCTIFQNGAEWNWNYCLRVFDRDGADVPDDVVAENNTCVNLDNHSGGACVSFQPGVTRAVCRNNLTWGPKGSGSPRPCEGSYSGGGNTKASSSSSPFVGTRFQSMSDFALASGRNPAVDVGVEPGAFWDAALKRRPGGAALDAGAFEFGELGERDARDEPTD